MRTRILALVFALLCVFSLALAENVSQPAQTVETLYTAISKEYTLPVYDGEAVTVEQTLSLPLYAQGEVASFDA